MSREIKFRAWDKVCKKMHHPDTSPGLVFHLNGCLALDQTWVTGDFELLQWTGLKDKDGNDVYEGDVIEAKHWAPVRYVVEFVEGGYCLTNPKLNGYPIDINLMYSSIGCAYEVIGNIYEHLDELLKK